MIEVQALAKTVPSYTGASHCLPIVLTHTHLLGGAGNREPINHLPVPHNMIYTMLAMTYMMIIARS